MTAVTTDAYTGLPTDIALRRSRLDEALDEAFLDAAVFASEGNSFYLTGYETTGWANRSKPFAVVYVRGQRPRVVCHVAEAVSVELDAIDCHVSPYVGPAVHRRGGHVELDYHFCAADEVIRILRGTEVRRIGVESTGHFLPGFSPAAVSHAVEQLVDGGFQLCDASSPMSRVRRRKSCWEVDRLRDSAVVLGRAHSAFAAEASVDMTERELGRLLIRSAVDAGADRVTYLGVIAGIDRAPLGGPTDRIWESGQILAVDCTLQVRGYHADFSRLYANGPPSNDQRKAYSGLLASLETARDVIRAGVTIREVATALIGEFETQYARVGHGLGVDPLEAPSLSPLDDTPLFAGEVLCLEPNRHVDGLGWIVAEEEVLVNASGCELISDPFPSSLEAVGCT